MPLLSRRLALSAIALSCAALVACGDEKSGSAPAAKASDTSPRAFYDALKTEAFGFQAGAATPKSPVYVVFDPQCPHCGALWEASREWRKTRAQIWVPIALLRAPANRPQGAVLLAAKDPVASMDEHEHSLLAHQGGISGMGAPQEFLTKVDKNSALASRFGLDSVPTLLVLTPTGQVIQVSGAPSPDQVAAFR